MTIESLGEADRFPEHLRAWRDVMLEIAATYQPTRPEDILGDLVSQTAADPTRLQAYVDGIQEGAKTSGRQPYVPEDLYEGLLHS